MQNGTTFDGISPGYVNRTPAEVPHIQVRAATLYFLVSLLLFILVAGTLCNACVILTICRTMTLRRSSINRAVLSLCCANLLALTLDLPLTCLVLVGNFHDFMVRIARRVIAFVRELHRTCPRFLSFIVRDVLTQTNRKLNSCHYLKDSFKVEEGK